MPNIFVNTNPLRDINDATCYPVQVGDTPRAFFEAHTELHDAMVICVVNREPVLRADWDKALQAQDVVLFVVRPRGGGGGSNPMRVLLMLAVLSFAAWAVGAMSLTGMMASVVKMGIVMAGSMLVNQLLPLPQPPDPAKVPEPSPTYSLRGQSNTPRLGQPIPMHYGRHIIWPDMIVQPWYEYEGSEQYYHMLCCLGVGKIVPESWKFGDMDFTSLGASVVQYQVAYPGQAITLLPAVVYSATLSGTELTNSFSASAYANPPATKVTQLGVDFAFTGLVRFDNAGAMQNQSVTVEVQARQVNDANTALTAWAVVSSKTYTYKTVDTIRDTIKINVTSARYEVRTRVTATPSTDSKVRDKCTWGGLRGYGQTHPNYGDVTVVAVRLRANELLSQQSTQQLNIVATRHLSEWATTWSALKPSRSIVWALADLYLNQSAGRQAENTLLLSELQAMHDKLNTLTHYFDYRFDQSGTKLLDAMQIAARAGRCALFNHLGYWRITRDDPRTAPVQMFTADNIRDFRLDITLPQAGEPDGIVGQFIRPDTWQADTVTIPRPGVTTPVNPETVQLTGITGRQHAWEEITYLARAEARRESGYLVTGMEGRIPVINDLIAVCPDGIDWGEWGSVLAVAGNTLTLSNPTSLSSGKIMLRGRDGKPLGTGTYDFSGSGSSVTVASLPAGVTAGGSAEPTYYMLGAANSDLVYCRVRSIEPEADDYVKITFIVEDASAYTPAGNAPANSNTGGGGSVVDPSAALNITWLRVAELVDNTDYKLTVSWSAVAEASSYALEVSSNGGSSWTRIYTGAATQTLYNSKPQALVFRVAAIKTLRGAWYTLNYTVGSGGNVSPPPSGLGLQAAFTGSICRIAWNLVSGISKYRLRIYNTSTLTLRRTVDLATNSYDYSYLMATDDGGPWRQLTFRLWSIDAAGNESATYTQVQVSNPQVGALANVTATGFQGMIMVEYDWPANQPDAAGVLVFMSPTSGFTPNSTTQVYDGTDAVIGIPASTQTTQYLRVAGYDFWGADSLTYSAQLTATAGKFNPFDIVGGLDPIPVVAALPNPVGYNGYTTVSFGGKLYKLVSGIWKAVTAGPIEVNAITAAMIQAGAISSDKIAANAIGADNIMANAVTAGKISVANLSAISAAMGMLTTGRLQNATGRALFNLDATGVQNFIHLKNTLDQDVLRINANGDAYFKGKVEVTELVATTAIIDTALIKNGISTLYGGTNNSVGSFGVGEVAINNATFDGGENMLCFFRIEGLRPYTQTFSGGDYTTTFPTIEVRMYVDTELLARVYIYGETIPESYGSGAVGTARKYYRVSDYFQIPSNYTGARNVWLKVYSPVAGGTTQTSNISIIKMKK
ncbi:host specificity factor TipJ family phage tail protein [Thiolinea disciformis]|uniref:host specificity factor TipJ family phage tail protein n=1 Tax=Thiolinea disciformis TaxID=125614 RepID=UPI00037CA05A|nr:host specificity factor TipJ family phage tail protein [Thiolinea disciformis]